MTYNKEKWIAAVQKAVKDLNTTAVTQGRVCSVATVRYIRDGLIDDIVGDKGKASKDDLAMADTVKECMNELLAQVSKSTDEGFASNASAAAKAAGFKSTAESVQALAE